jgi:spermidine/putrescine transport system substrate-binding protein
MSLSRRSLLQKSLQYARYGTVAAGAVGLTQALGGCGIFESGKEDGTKAEEAPKPDARNQKTLYIYGWATYVGDEVKEVMEGFTEETGIKVKGDSYDSNEVLLAKLLANGGRLDYSVIYPSDYMVSQMVERDLLMPLDHSRLSNMKNIDPKFLRTPYDVGGKHSVPLSLGTTGIAYNIQILSSLIGEEPKDWNYFWEYKDKLRITLVNDPREVLGMGLHTLGYSYNAKQESQIKQAFNKLRELMPAIANFTSDAWRDMLISGDLMACMVYSGDGIRVARQDPNIKYILPQSGTSIWTDTVAILRSAPNPDAAHAWINYLMRPEIAAKISDANSFGTTNRPARAKIPEDLRSIPAWQPSPQFEKRSGRITKLDQSVLQMYESYWTRLSSGLG